MCCHQLFHGTYWFGLAWGRQSEKMFSSGNTNSHANFPSGPTMDVLNFNKCSPQRASGFPFESRAQSQQWSSPSPPSPLFFKQWKAVVETASVCGSRKAGVSVIYRTQTGTPLSFHAAWFPPLVIDTGFSYLFCLFFFKLPRSPYRVRAVSYATG